MAEIVLVTNESQTYSYLKSLLDSGMYTVQTLASRGYFKNLCPYPSKSDFTDQVKICECCGKADIILSAEKQAQDVRDAYHKEDSRLERLFREMLYYENHITGPKADRIFSLAWSDGHSEGYHSVAYYFEKYFKFIREIETLPEGPYKPCMEPI